MPSHLFSAVRRFLDTRFTCSVYALAARILAANDSPNDWRVSHKIARTMCDVRGVFTIREA